MKNSFRFTHDNSQYTTVYCSLDEAGAVLKDSLLSCGKTFEIETEFTCIEAVDFEGTHWYAVRVGHTDEGTHTDRAGAESFLADGGEDTFGEDYATHFDENEDQVDLTEGRWC
jgi:hypothetical protein